MLIWTGFSGEGCGPWASCFFYNFFLLKSLILKDFMKNIFRVCWNKILAVESVNIYIYRHNFSLLFLPSPLKNLLHVDFGVSRRYTKSVDLSKCVMVYPCVELPSPCWFSFGSHLEWLVSFWKHSDSKYLQVIWKSFIRKNVNSMCRIEWLTICCETYKELLATSSWNRIQ